MRDKKTTGMKHSAEVLEERWLSFTQEQSHLLGFFFAKGNTVQMSVNEEVNPNLTVDFHLFVHTAMLKITYTDFLRF